MADLQFESFDNYFAGVPSATLPIGTAPMLVLQGGTTKQIPASTVAGITINSTSITGGSNGHVLYDNSGTVGEASNFTINSGNPNVADMTSGGQYQVNGSVVLEADPTNANWFLFGAGNTTVSGIFNIGIGSLSGFAPLMGVTSGSENVCIGVNAGQSITTASGNICIGTNSGSVLNTNSNISIGTGALFTYSGAGTGNIAIGLNAATHLVSGQNNTAIGSAAMGNAGATAGNDNVAIGANSLLALGGTSNMGIGAFSLTAEASGNSNVGVGVGCLASQNGASQNTGIGSNTLTDLTTGGNNVGIGYNTGRGITTGQDNTVLGAQVGGLGANLSNAIILADGAGTIRLDYNDNNSGTWTLAQGLILSYISTAGVLVASSSGAVTSDSSAVAATVAGNFSADHRLQVTIGVTTYYIAMSTVAW